MSKTDWKTLATLFLGLAWIVVAYVAGPTDSGEVGLPQTLSQASLGDTGSPKQTLYPVVHVVDGDTIDVMKDGKKVRVRFIGINAPESVDPRRPVQCFGIEASTEMERMLSGQSVSLETDPSQDLYDKYGRLLAYVYQPDGTDVGLHMIEAGYAYEYTYDLPYAHQAQYKAAQARAERDGSGLWAKGACGG